MKCRSRYGDEQNILFYFFPQYLRFVSRCWRNWPNWLHALTSRFGSESMWIMRLIASNNTAFLAFECCTFFDFGGSWALFRIVSKHSESLFFTAASSVNQFFFWLFSLFYSVFRSKKKLNVWMPLSSKRRIGKALTRRRVMLQQSQQFNRQPRRWHEVVRVILQVGVRRRHNLKQTHTIQHLVETRSSARPGLLRWPTPIGQSSQNDCDLPISVEQRSRLWCGKAWTHWVPFLFVVPNGERKRCVWFRETGSQGQQLRSWRNLFCFWKQAPFPGGITWKLFCFHNLLDSASTQQGTRILCIHLAFSWPTSLSGSQQQ